MKPEKEQLENPKWWNGYAKPEDKYCYQCEKSGDYFFSSILDYSRPEYILIAIRPEVKIKSKVDWLIKGGRVITPKGEAEVYTVTEYNGVNTSLGNFSRSELSEVKPKWKPKEGEWCEVRTRGKWRKAKTLNVDLGTDSLGFYVPVSENGLSLLIWCSHYRPLKTKREELIDIVAASLQKDDQDVTGLSNKSKDMFVSGAKEAVDSILARYELTEKDGE